MHTDYFPSFDDTDFDDTAFDAPSSGDVLDLTGLPLADDPPLLLLDLLWQAADKGWTPDDLRHCVGPSVEPYLSPARTQILAGVTPLPSPIREAWRHQQEPRHDGTGDRSRRERAPLRTWHISDLPRLADASRYIDLHRPVEPKAGTTESPDATERARHRIGGLLRKAASTTFPAEAETLVAKAQQLQQRYRIDQLVHEESDGGANSQSPDETVSARIPFHAPWVRQQYLLLALVAAANSCRTVLMEPLGLAFLLGHVDDVRYTAELFSSLNHQRDYFMRHSPGAEAARRSRTTSAYRRSFLHSYAHRISDLLRASAADAPMTEQEKTCLLPALAHREETARITAHKLFPGTSGMAFQHRHHLGGAADGVRAAERSHLGTEPTGLTSA